MYRLANFDVSHWARSPGGKLAARLTFGLACGVGMVLVRMVLDVVAPTAGPFALVYPTVLLATLYGHWHAGIVAFAATFFWAWYVVLAPAYSLQFAVDTDPSRVIINAISACVVIVFAETFRRAVKHAVEQRDREIEHRRMLLAEIEHRTKNNFALVVSMLELQKRRDGEPAIAAALDQAIARVNSFARAYANLSDRQGEGATVRMRPYMQELVEHIRNAGFAPNVSVLLDCADCELPRETAVAIGLCTNEALTNSAKHAFPDMRPGSVAVVFVCEGEAWSLTVSDDGVGTRADNRPVPGAGLGTRLYEAFAQQAGGRISDESSKEGRRVTLVSA